MNKLNVLLYNGPGVSSMQDLLLKTLRQHLSHRYDIILVDEIQLNHEPWEDTCALIVIPGGADLPYLKSLAPLGTSKIAAFVSNGGSYMGICAGAYFGCSRIEFEVGKPNEVVGSRPLGFNGVAIGSVSPNFTYNSELGASVMDLKLKDGRSTRLYVNGGPYFEGEGHDVIARYADTDKPAIIECNYGKGKAILSGPHLEVDHVYLRDASLQLKKDHPDQSAHLGQIIPKVEASDKVRVELWQTVLTWLGLSLNQTADDSQPTTMWISTLHSRRSEDMMADLKKKSWTAAGGSMHIVDTTNQWTIETGTSKPKMDVGNMAPLAELLGKFNLKKRADSVSDSLVLQFCNRDPTTEVAFNVSKYHQHLKEYAKTRMSRSPDFGSTLIYSERTTSTQTVIDQYL
jgi:biotin---protein ligase